MLFSIREGLEPVSKNFKSLRVLKGGDGFWPGKGKGMQFLYHPDAGVQTLTVRDDAYRYLFKVRRCRGGEPVMLRNLKDARLLTYRVAKIDRKEAWLRLEASCDRPVFHARFLHIGWCVVDPKTVEKSLPMLNELGVAKISFVYCDRSQKNFHLDFERLEKILVNSCQQCGRSALMEIEVIDGAAEYFRRYPESGVLDFGGVSLEGDIPESMLIGCEGGFSEAEHGLLTERPVFGLKTPLILRSESAVMATAAKCLL